LDIGVLGYIGIVWPKEHSPEVWFVPPVTPCIFKATNLSSYRMLNPRCARLADHRHLNVTIHWKLLKLSSIARLIPQSVQLQAQVRLASLGWCYNLGGGAKPYARIPAYFFRAEKVPVFFCLRSSCYHVIEVEGP